jgi:hypothetical protein
MLNGLFGSGCVPGRTTALIVAPALVAPGLALMHGCVVDPVPQVSALRLPVLNGKPRARLASGSAR